MRENEWRLKSKIKWNKCWTELKMNWEIIEIKKKTTNANARATRAHADDGEGGPKTFLCTANLSLSFRFFLFVILLWFHATRYCFISYFNFNCRKWGAIVSDVRVVDGRPTDEQTQTFRFMRLRTTVHYSVVQYSATEPRTMPITVCGDSDGDDVCAFKNKSKRCDASIHVASAARRLFIVFILYIYIYFVVVFFQNR